MEAWNCRFVEWIKKLQDNRIKRCFAKSKTFRPKQLPALSVRIEESAMLEV